MLPVVNSDGRSTALRIEIYSVVLIPVSMLPSFTGIAGHTYRLELPFWGWVCFILGSG